jgi:3-oxoacyl-[acyl-carrier-protein] synthase II
VVVTGAGIITAMGRGWRENADGFRTGRTCFRPVTLFDTARQRVKTAAELDLPDQLPPNRLTQRQASRLDRATRMLVHAAGEATAQARWPGGLTVPLVLGTTSGGMSLGEDYFRQATETPRRFRKQPTRVLNYQPQIQALHLANALALSGPVTIIANACASGANSIGHAWHLIRTGQSEMALAGGYDALSHLVYSGFDSLQALSTSTCRPFDSQRDGLALGEGAAVLTLESLDSYRQTGVDRGAEILGEIVGYGAANDAHHLTQPHPQGTAALSSMTSACTVAGVGPEQISYLNAHGTGTSLNDAAEAAAINSWAGPHAATVSVSSTKAGIGHLLGAAGSVETIICLMALREGWLPPTTTTKNIDPACQFKLVREPMDQPLNYALTNSFGFGGANATLVLRRWS